MISDQAWTDERWREHNRMLAEAGGVVVMPDQQGEINVLTDKICAWDSWAFDDFNVLSMRPKAIDLSRSVLECLFTWWTLVTQDPQYFKNGGADFTNPPEQFVDTTWHANHDPDDNSTPTLYAVSSKHTTAFALSHPSQWTLLAAKVMDPATWSPQVNASWGCDAQRTSNPHDKPSQPYMVKFGDYLVVAVVCVSCAEELSVQEQTETFGPDEF